MSTKAAQDMELAARFIEALRPIIGCIVERHAPGVEYGPEAVLLAHKVRWSEIDLVNTPSDNTLRHDAAVRAMFGVGWNGNGFPHDTHIRALHVATMAVEIACLRLHGARTFVHPEVQEIIEQFKLS